jgi:hypothetical protein
MKLFKFQILRLCISIVCNAQTVKSALVDGTESVSNTLLKN